MRRTARQVSQARVRRGCPGPQTRRAVTLALKCSASRSACAVSSSSVSPRSRSTTSAGSFLLAPTFARSASLTRLVRVHVRPKRHGPRAAAPPSFSSSSLSRAASASRSLVASRAVSRSAASAFLPASDRTVVRLDSAASGSTGGVGGVSDGPQPCGCSLLGSARAGCRPPWAGRSKQRASGHAAGCGRGTPRASRPSPQVGGVLQADRGERRRPTHPVLLARSRPPRRAGAAHRPSASSSCIRPDAADLRRGVAEILERLPERHADRVQLLRRVDLLRHRRRLRVTPDRLHRLRALGQRLFSTRSASRITRSHEPPNTRCLRSRPLDQARLARADRVRGRRVVVL
jgi:hypothetical protein